MNKLILFLMVILFTTVAFSDDIDDVFYENTIARFHKPLKDCCKAQIKKAYAIAIKRNEDTRVQQFHCYTICSTCNKVIEFYTSDNPNFRLLEED